jgi:hypothetical protein
MDVKESEERKVQGEKELEAEGDGVGKDDEGQEGAQAHAPKKKREQGKEAPKKRARANYPPDVLKVMNDWKSTADVDYPTSAEKKIMLEKVSTTRPILSFTRFSLFSSLLSSPLPSSPPLFSTRF